VLFCRLPADFEAFSRLISGGFLWSVSCQRQVDTSILFAVS
jgi:hypothetical protein